MCVCTLKGCNFNAVVTIDYVKWPLKPEALDPRFLANSSLQDVCGCSLDDRNSHCVSLRREMLRYWHVDTMFDSVSMVCHTLPKWTSGFPDVRSTTERVSTRYQVDNVRCGAIEMPTDFMALRSQINFGNVVYECTSFAPA